MTQRALQVPFIPNTSNNLHSHLINLHHLKNYFKGKGGCVIMTDGGEIEVAVPVTQSVTTVAHVE